MKRTLILSALVLALIAVAMSLAVALAPTLIVAEPVGEVIVNVPADPVEA